jgi:hypothetical protein
MRGFYGHSRVSSGNLVRVRGRIQAGSACCFLVMLSFSRAVRAAEIALQSQDGRRVIVAAEARTPITLDGVLDEDVWRAAVPASDFVQAEPHEGQAATEPTDVRLAFDRNALYIGVLCHDSTPSDLIVNDIRKDFTAGEQDTFDFWRYPARVAARRRAVRAARRGDAPVFFAADWPVGRRERGSRWWTIDGKRGRFRRRGDDDSNRVGRGACGRHLHGPARPPQHHAELGHRRDRSLAPVERRLERSEPGDRVRREFPVRPCAQPERIRDEVVHAGRGRRRARRKGIGDVERQFSAYGWI